MIRQATRQRRSAAAGVVVAAHLMVACAGPGATGGGVTSTGGDRANSTESSSSSAGRAQAPDFELTTLDGDTVRLSDHLGKDVILIDFWATFCDPCLASMPQLDALYRKYQDEGFIVLGVSIDGPDSMAQVRTEVSKMGVTFPILLDTETRVVSLYNPKTSAPYSVLIGRDGGIIKKKEGYTTGDAADVEQDIVEALR